MANAALCLPDLCRPLRVAGRAANYLKEVLMAATDVNRGSVRADRDGSSVGRDGSSVGRAARRLATETKQAFKTTEFWAMVALVVSILVSAAVIKGGDDGTDQFIARQAWLYVS